MSLEPTFARYLAAAGYELLAVFAVVFAAAVPWVMAMPDQHVPAGNLAFQGYLLVMLNVYFSVAWMRGGQSLGMRPWRLYVIADGQPRLSWARAIARYWLAILSWAALGLGIAWFAFTGRSWHDLATGTRVVYRPRTD